MDLTAQLFLIGGICIAGTCLGIYLGIMIGTGQVRWLKVTRRRK
jgi:hypothetical protein